MVTVVVADAVIPVVSLAMVWLCEPPAVPVDGVIAVPPTMPAAIVVSAW
jgi:hypothetical protein